MLVEIIFCLIAGFYLGAAYINLTPDMLFDQTSFLPTILDALLYLPTFITEHGVAGNLTSAESVYVEAEQPF